MDFIPMLQRFYKMIIWRKKKKTDLKWSEYHISVVRDYVSKFEPGLRVLSSVELFKQNLEQFFLVPKLFDDALKKNEVAAAFINFLFQLLYETNFFDGLHEELRFLLMVLGDAPFLYYDRKHGVQINLLVEVEEIANVAGSLVYSLIFLTNEDPELHTIDQRYGVLLKSMASLKGNILKFSKLSVPVITKDINITNSKTNSSVFIVDSLICDLDNLLNRDDSLIANVKDQIKVIHQELMLCRSLMKNSIMVPPPHSSDIQEHVIRIVQVVYEAEYLINSFLSGDAPLWYFSTRLPHVFHKIKLIGTGLQEINNNYEIGALKLANKFNSLELPVLQGNMRKSEFDDNIVVGFEDVATHILDKLVGGGTSQLQFIFIFGMPGLGKTTFAKKMYNDPIVSYRFDIRSWCVVSQIYQRKRLLTDILINSSIQLDKDKILNMKEEESIAEKIYKSLKGRRYLIVIDDVWDVNAWNDVRRCFPDDRNGSRILITSRNKDVAPSNSIMCALPYLSNDQCWELLEKKVFKDKSCPLQLLGVGKQIAANCHGLPLAVVVIAGILSTTDKKDNAWKKVGEKVFSYYSCGENDYMMQILELSYENMPQYLKPCFLYFGVFLEDAEISVKKLTRLWVAEGFIPKGERKSSERLAEEYLMELIDKSLIMVAKRSSGGGVKTCIIHDRLRDLCLKISEEENFLKLVVDDIYSMYEKSHRVVQSQHPCVQSSFGLHVRSFHGHYTLVSPFFLANMKLVRVLDFICVYSRARLVGVEYLVNLRYLVIHGDFLSSIGSFVNLEYLCVVDSIKMPSLILKMDRLRYLHFTGYGAYFDEDCNTSRTNNLQVLSNVFITNLKHEEILKCSPHLRKLKCKCAPFYVKKKGAYRYLDLLFFTHLESLNMLRSQGRDRQVLEINFPMNIKKLVLYNLRLPLVNMSIIGGLPNLQVLKLRSQVFLGETWETRDGEFLQLTFLKLEKTNFKQWNVTSSQHFPKLQRLVLHGCNNLQEFPCEIGEIPTLQLIELVLCGQTLEESARNIEQEQRDVGNEELKVIIKVKLGLDAKCKWDISSLLNNFEGKFHVYLP